MGEETEAAAIAGVGTLIDDCVTILRLLRYLRLFGTTREVTGESRTNMKNSKTLSVLLASAMLCGAGVTVLAQDNSAGQDMKNAGTDTKDAAKDAGHATETGTKKVYHHTKSGTHTAYDKTKEGTHTAADRTKEGTQTAADKTKEGTEKVVSPSKESENESKGQRASQLDQGTGQGERDGPEGR